MASYDRGDTHTIFVNVKRGVGIFVEPDEPPTVDIYAKNGGGYNKIVTDATTTKIEDGMYSYEFTIGDTDPYGDYLVISKALFNGVLRRGRGAFAVQIDTAAIVLEESGYGFILQYTRVALLSTTRIKFKAPSGRTDVKFSVLAESGTPIIVDQSMTELSNSGVYEYNWAPTEEGQFTILGTSEGIDDSIGIEVISGQGSITTDAHLV
jgi:hypothetical protein